MLNTEAAYLLSFIVVFLMFVVLDVKCNGKFMYLDGKKH
ncbi:hypothetical protein PAUR_b0655 [Pseudoalteromonas aurantia 208]|uniref:Uncharacterized protein n=1 Tax=Pseudoalteromonas aurantia 208 TaxID=1314867 RepID=A0ABR9EHW7_9GAMM|nr:hypothetical protein [Pseudoalteromonas aurantia 208]